MRVLLIHNPDAGYGSHSRPDLREAIERAGHTVVDAGRDLSDISSRIVDMAVVAGGDGAVGRAATALRGSGLPIAVLPLGTANNIANQLGAHKPFPALIGDWASRAPAEFDLGKLSGPAEDHFFVESFGIGLIGAAISADEAAAEQREKDRAKKASKREGGPGAGYSHDRLRASMTRLREQATLARPISVHLVLDGHEWTGRFLMVEVMNIGCIGPRLCLAPSADPADGLLDLVLLGVEGRAAFVDWMTDLLDGREPRQPSGVVVHRVERVTLTWDGASAHLDGASLSDAELMTEGGHGDLAATVTVTADKGAARMISHAP